MKTTFYFLCILLFFSCSKDPISETIIDQNEVILTDTTEVDDTKPALSIVSSGEDCNDVDPFLICEVLEKQDIEYIASENLDLLPEAQLGIDAMITFSNGSATTEFTITYTDHYILEERVNIPCNENYEYTTYICQANEIKELHMVNEHFGSDPITLLLRSMSIDYDGQEVGEKTDLYTLFQEVPSEGIANMVFRYWIGKTDFEGRVTSYHDELVLNGNSFTDVIEFKLLKNVLAEPHARFYVKKGLGFFAFEKGGVVWVKE